MPLPVEFEALGYRPERWAPEDVVRIRSHGLVSNLTDQVERALVLREFGREAEALRKRLEPRWRYEIPEGLDLDVIPDDVLDVYDLAIAPVEFAERDGRAVRRARVRQGSNNWAIAGRRTASGRPILANDPHRAQGVPSLRYLAHLVAPGLNVIGAGEPALPGISIGHNERIAFGLTIFAIDQEDLYVYETRPGSPDEYRYRDGWERDDRHRGGRSRCKDSAPERVTLRFTRHGPVIAEDERRRTAFAVRSVWFEPGTSAYFASISYMRAGNWREFVGGLRRWGAPGENQVYADRAGHIGWKPCGFTPIRHNWDGLLPVPGDGRYEWDGFLDADRLPVERDPERGWIATANAENLPRGYPYRSPQDRVRVGGAVPLAAHPGGAAPPARCDRGRLAAPPGRPPLASGCADRPAARRPRAARPPHRARDPAAAPLGPRARAGLQRRRAVRGLERDRAADRGAPRRAWLTEGRRRDLARRSDRDPRAARATRPAARAPSAARPRSRAADQPREGHRPHRGAARQALVALGVGRAARRAASSIRSRPLSTTRSLAGLRSVRYRWGAAVRPSATPATSTAGPPEGVEATRAFFQVASGASFRQVIDVGAWDRSRVINNPGQSGDPSSPHYRDLIERWATGRTVPLLYSRARVEAAAEQRIVCTPRPEYTGRRMRRNSGRVYIARADL